MAARWEEISGGTAYLVVIAPEGSVHVERVHPDGSTSGISFGGLTAEAIAVREMVDRFRTGSDHRGEW